MQSKDATVNDTAKAIADQCGLDSKYLPDLVKTIAKVWDTAQENAPTEVLTSEPLNDKEIDAFREYARSVVARNG